MSVKILQIMQAPEDLHTVYVSRWILDKDLEKIQAFLEEVKHECLRFPNDIDVIAKNAEAYDDPCIYRTKVIALALVEKGNKTYVVPLHLVKDNLVLSDEIDGYLGMVSMGSVDEEDMLTSYAIEALEALRDG
jgi:hypothetical protein